MHSRPAPKLGFSFEYLMWIFTRISGAALIFLALFGMAGAFLMGARTAFDEGTLMRWTFFPISWHVSNYVPDINVWDTPFWRIIQILLVSLGITHGINGLRVVIEDYLGASWKRVFLRGLLFVFWLFMLIVAVYVILTLIQSSG
jgi:succinate dehydrogenase / fumarate reductase membrane anchor subunit